MHSLIRYQWCRRYECVSLCCSFLSWLRTMQWRRSRRSCRPSVHEGFQTFHISWIDHLPHTSDTNVFPRSPTSSRSNTWLELYQKEQQPSNSQAAELVSSHELQWWINQSINQWSPVHARRLICTTFVKTPRFLHIFCHTDRSGKVAGNTERKFRSMRLRVMQG